MPFSDQQLMTKWDVALCRLMGINQEVCFHACRQFNFNFNFEIIYLLGSLYRWLIKIKLDEYKKLEKDQQSSLDKITDALLPQNQFPVLSLFICDDTIHYPFIDLFLNTVNVLASIFR